mgnify:CR=1 FL=1|jgi:hypothetical protein
MGIINLNSSIRYSHCGRKRKTKAFTVKKKPPVDFKTTLQYKETIRRQEQQYKSIMEEYMKNGEYHLINGDCTKQESPVYTGTLVKGIATMHKSNAVPVISQKEAEEISKMSS